MDWKRLRGVVLLSLLTTDKFALNMHVRQTTVNK
jgi:hypothetical protein